MLSDCARTLEASPSTKHANTRLRAMAATPLIIGADIRNMAKQNLEIYLKRCHRDRSGLARHPGAHGVERRQPLDLPNAPRRWRQRGGVLERRDDTMDRRERDVCAARTRAEWHVYRERFVDED